MTYTVYTTARQTCAILDIKRMHANLGCGKVYRRSDILATTHAQRNSKIAEQRQIIKLKVHQAKQRNSWKERNLSWARLSWMYPESQIITNDGSVVKEVMKLKHARSLCKNSGYVDDLTTVKI